jgi:hypothetical protein
MENCPKELITNCLFHHSRCSMQAFCGHFRLSISFKSQEVTDIVWRHSRELYVFGPEFRNIFWGFYIPCPEQVDQSNTYLPVSCSRCDPKS